MSWPSKTHPAARGRRNPTMVLNAVDLPAPLGPMTLTISPARTSRVTSWRMAILP